MASPRILSISRTLFTKQTLSSILRPRSFTSSSSIATKSASPFSLNRLRHLAAVSPAIGSFRTFSTRQAQTSLSDNPNWSNRPPKETILLDGCDFEHWLVVTEPPPENTTRDEIIDSYVKTLAQIVGSEEEARMKIYSVSTRCYFAFGALVSEELSYKLKELPNVRWVLPDSYLDVRNKDYGGEPFINGQAVPYDPKYHEEWIRNNQKAQDRNRRNDRPRNNDRSRNFERRQSTPGPGFQNNPRTGTNMAGPDPRGPPPPPNPSYGQQNNLGGNPRGPPPPNPGYGQQQNPGGYGQNTPRENQGYASNNPGFNQGSLNSGPPNYQGQGNPGFQGNVPNYQGQGNPGFQGNVPNNQGQGNPGFQGNMPNYQGQGNPGFQGNVPNYQGQGQNGQMPPNPQGNIGSAYQGQDVAGRDMPRY